jgi:aconitase B
MLKQEQLDNWFTYHAPTDETRPKYEQITLAESRIQDELVEDVNIITHDAINGTLRDFVVLIDSLAPDSADKTAAIRCVRIARNALNEAVMCRKNDPDRARMLARIASDEIIKARWQANSAIACGGV